jgi:hypothetical protein
VFKDPGTQNALQEFPTGDRPPVSLLVSLLALCSVPLWLHLSWVVGQSSRPCVEEPTPSLESLLLPIHRSFASLLPPAPDSLAWFPTIVPINNYAPHPSIHSTTDRPHLRPFCLSSTPPSPPTIKPSHTPQVDLS